MGEIRTGRQMWMMLLHRNLNRVYNEWVWMVDEYFLYGWGWVFGGVESFGGTCYHIAYCMRFISYSPHGLFFPLHHTHYKRGPFFFTFNHFLGVSVIILF